jgi:hypothetical protein
MTVEELAYKVDNEGLGYAVLDYFGRQVDVDDDTVKQAWAEAYDALDRLRQLIPEV